MKRLFVSLFILLSFCTSMFAQDTAKESEVKKVSLDEAISLALENNISIKRQSIALNTLEKRSAYSWNNIFPTISASGNYQTNFLDPVTSSWSVSGGVNLRLAPSVYTTMKGAKLNYENGITDYNNTIKNIELGVRKTYLNLLYMKDNLALQKRNLETARQRYTSSREKYNRGQLSELDLLTSQYNYESQKPAIESLENTYENAVANFKQTIGVDQSIDIELTGSLEDYYKTYDLEVEYNLEELPSIKKLNYQIENAKNNLLATRFTAWGPSLSASYSYSVSGREGSDTTTKRGDLTLGVAIPLDGFLPWSSGALSVDSQKAMLKDYELQKENQMTMAKVELESAIKQIKQAQSQLKTLQSNVTLAQKTYNMTLTAYNHGTRDLLTLQNASDNLLRAKISVQSQMYTIISLVMDLENTLGVPFGTLTKN